MSMVSYWEGEHRVCVSVGGWMGGCIGLRISNWSETVGLRGVDNYWIDLSARASYWWSPQCIYVNTRTYARFQLMAFHPDQP